MAEQQIGRILPTDTACWDAKKQLYPSKPGNGNYWCPYCQKAAGFFVKPSDMWKHVNQFHETFQQWECRHPGCMLRFCHKADFVKHHKALHQGCRGYCWAAYPFEIKVVACGIDGCQRVFYGDGPEGKPGNAVFDGRQHIADHMKPDQMERGRQTNEWSYSTMMRNLLRQPDIAAEWERVLEMEGFHTLYQPRFEWTQNNPDLLRYQLQTRVFANVRDLVLRVFTSAQPLDPLSGMPMRPLAMVNNPYAIHDIDENKDEADYDYVRRPSDCSLLREHEHDTQMTDSFSAEFDATQWLNPDFAWPAASAGA